MNFKSHLLSLVATSTLFPHSTGITNKVSSTRHNAKLVALLPVLSGHKSQTMRKSINKLLEKNSKTIEFKNENKQILVFAHFPSGIIQSYPLAKFQVCFDPDSDGDCPDGEDIQTLIFSEGYKYRGMVEFSNLKNDIIFSLQFGFPIDGWVYIWNERNNQPQFVGSMDGNEYIGKYKSPNSTKIAFLTTGNRDSFYGFLHIMDFPNKKFTRIDDGLIADLDSDKTHFIFVDSFKWLSNTDFSIDYRILNNPEGLEEDDPTPSGVAYFRYSFENGQPKYTKIEKPSSIKMKRTAGDTSKKTVKPKAK